MTNRTGRQPGLFDDGDDGLPLVVAPSAGPPAPPGPFAADEAARRYAVDPRHNVVLEASAGTGKTTGARPALPEPARRRRRPGEHPGDHLHAQGRGRDARADHRRAAPGRGRERRRAARAGCELRDRVGDIAISTIDAFCYALLREFPLEAGLAPGFSVADETEAARLAEEAHRSRARPLPAHRRARSGGGAGADADHAAAAARRPGAPASIAASWCRPACAATSARAPALTPEALRDAGGATLPRGAGERCPAGCRRSWPRGRSRTRASALVAADLRAIAARRGRRSGDARRRRRDAALLLPHQGRQAAAASVHGYKREDARLGGRVEAAHRRR